VCHEMALVVASAVKPSESACLVWGKQSLSHPSRGSRWWEGAPRRVAERRFAVRGSSRASNAMQARCLVARRQEEAARRAGMEEAMLRNAGPACRPEVRRGERRRFQSPRCQPQKGNKPKPAQTRRRPPMLSCPCEQAGSEAQASEPYCGTPASALGGCASQAARPHAREPAESAVRSGPRFARPGVSGGENGARQSGRRERAAPA